MLILTMLLSFCAASSAYLLLDKAFRWAWLYLPTTLLGYLLAIFLASGWPSSAPLPSPAIVFSAVPGAGVVASPVNTYAPRFYGVEVPHEIMAALERAKGSPVVVTKSGEEGSYIIELPGKMIKKSDG